MNLHTMKRKSTQFFSDSRSIYLTQPLFNACFYGLKAVFVFYVMQQFSLSEAESISLYSTFMTLCYGTALIGGYLGDQWLGIRNTVILGGILASSGLLLCVLAPSLDVCFLGLAVMALGSGCFKANLLASVGLMFGNPKDPAKDRAYSIIYTWMNVGIFVFVPVCGWFGKTFGWDLGVVFVAIVFMAVTFLYYRSMKLRISGKQKGISAGLKLCGGLLSLVAFLYALFKNPGTFHGAVGIIVAAAMGYLGLILYRCTPQERKGVWASIGYLLLFMLFAGLFEQSGTSLLLFYEKAVDRQMMGLVIPASFFISLGSFFILFCSPPLLFLFARYWEKTKPIHGFVKSGYGFLLAALGFWILALSISETNACLVSPSWVVLTIFVWTVAELLIVPVGMSQISRNAPERYQSIMMSFWTVSIACAHYIAGIIAKFSVAAPTAPEGYFAHYRPFFFYVGLIPLAIGALIFLYRGIVLYVSGRQQEAGRCDK